jgi:hypothetical protein
LQFEIENLKLFDPTAQDKTGFTYSRNKLHTKIQSLKQLPPESSRQKWDAAQRRMAYKLHTKMRLCSHNPRLCSQNLKQQMSCSTSEAKKNGFRLSESLCACSKQKLNSERTGAQNHQLTGVPKGKAGSRICETKKWTGSGAGQGSRAAAQRKKKKCRRIEDLAYRKGRPDAAPSQPECKLKTGARDGWAVDEPNQQAPGDLATGSTHEEKTKIEDKQRQRKLSQQPQIQINPNSKEGNNTHRIKNEFFHWKPTRLQPICGGHRPLYLIFDWNKN